LFGKEGMEKKIVIPLKIFNSDSLLMQTLKLMEHGKVVHKGREFLFGGEIFKTEEEFEKVSQDHQMAHLTLHQIQESEKNLLGLEVSSVKMGIGDKDPVLFGTSQTRPHLPTPQ
jgi:hypothetical protein